jgi:hypothetical protein
VSTLVKQLLIGYLGLGGRLELSCIPGIPGLNLDLIFDGIPLNCGVVLLLTYVIT